MENEIRDITFLVVGQLSNANLGLIESMLVLNRAFLSILLTVTNSYNLSPSDTTTMMHGFLLELENQFVRIQNDHIKIEKHKLN